MADILMKSPVWTFLLVLLASGGAYAATTGAAAELGVIGPVYPIKEQDFLQWIQKRITSMQQSGELEKLQQQELDKARKRVERPEPVAGITRTVKPREFHVDPTLVVDQAITDAKGRVIAMPGTKVNPLDYMALSKHLIFINADDPEQVTWADAMDVRYAGKVKTILVAGAPLDLMRKWQRRVYFDQHGVLSKRFRIRHVPAIVSHYKRQLRVAEVLP